MTPMVILRRFLLHSGSFPHNIQAHKPKVTAAHGHTSMYIYVWVPEVVRKSLAGWKFALRTHLWINREKLGHMSREEKSRLEFGIAKLWSTWLCDVCLPGIFSPSCLENVSRLNAAFKSLCSYMRRWGFYQTQTEDNGKYLYFIQAKARNCLFRYASEKSLKPSLRHCSVKFLRSIFDLNWHQRETINWIISLTSKKYRKRQTLYIGGRVWHSIYNIPMMTQTAMTLQKKICCSSTMSRATEQRLGLYYWLVHSAALWALLRKELVSETCLIHAARWKVRMRNGRLSWREEIGYKINWEKIGLTK